MCCIIKVASVGGVGVVYDVVVVVVGNCCGCVVDVVGCATFISIVVTVDVDDIILYIVCCVVFVHDVVGWLLLRCRCRCMIRECMLYSSHCVLCCCCLRWR